MTDDRFRVLAVMTNLDEPSWGGVSDLVGNTDILTQVDFAYVLGSGHAVIVKDREGRAGGTLPLHDIQARVDQYAESPDQVYVIDLT